MVRASSHRVIHSTEVQVTDFKTQIVPVYVKDAGGPVSTARLESTLKISCQSHICVVCRLDNPKHSIMQIEVEIHSNAGRRLPHLLVVALHQNPEANVTSHCSI